MLAYCQAFYDTQVTRFLVFPRLWVQAADGDDLKSRKHVFFQILFLPLLFQIVLLFPIFFFYPPFSLYLDLFFCVWNSKVF